MQIKLIYNELLIRDFRVDVGLVEHYGKDEEGKSTKKQLEVDFVATKGSKKYYIQSAFSMSDPEKIEQEQRSLKSINGSFKKFIGVRDNIKVRRNDYCIVTM